MDQYIPTFCMNGRCPFLECMNHLSHVKELDHRRTVSVAPLDGVCRRYIDYLLEEEMKGLKKHE